MQTPNADRAQPGWRFWLTWMGATIASVVVFTILVSLIPAIISWVNPFAANPNTGIVIGLISFAALGATIGFAQWLVLHRYLTGIGAWILATLVGCLAPNVLMPVIPRLEPNWVAGIILFLMYGAGLGVLQWLVLRGRVSRAGWWIAISVAGWLFAYALTGIVVLSGLYVEPFDMLAAFLVPVAAAGGGMVWLLRQEPHHVDPKGLGSQLHV